MLELRPYQQECITEIISFFENHDRQLIQLPTGAGKTILFWEYISKHCSSALIIVPSIQLGEQVLEASSLFVHSSQVSAKFGAYRSSKIKPYHIITSASLQYESTMRLLKTCKFDALIIDEAHKVRAEGFEKALSKLNCYKKMLGVTATPFRTDQKDLLKTFGSLTFKKSLYSLIEEGFLADLEGIRIQTQCDLKHDGKREDFSSSSLYKQLATTSRNELIADVFSKYAGDKKTLIFCINIKHSQEIAELLKKRGIMASSINGYDSLEERQKILKQFQEGKIQVLTNAQLLTEGFDEPSIEALIIARPTISKVLYLQMIGRGTRRTETKKLCRVIDICDNYQRLCSFFSLAFPESDLRQTNRPHNDFLKLSEIEKEKEKFEIYLKDYKDELIDFKSFDSPSLLDSPQFYMKDIIFPDHTTLREALFLRWKKEKIKELTMISGDIKKINENLFSVEIGKGKEIQSYYFKDIKTAQVFLDYKSTLMQEVKDFNISPEELLTLSDGLQIKLKIVETEDDKHPKYITDLQRDISSFQKMLPSNVKMKDISSEMLIEIIDKMSGTTVFRGGSQYDKEGFHSGKEVAISPHTLRRRLFALSTVYNCVKANTGATFLNPVALVMPYFRKKYLGGKK